MVNTIITEKIHWAEVQGQITNKSIDCQSQIWLIGEPKSTSYYFISNDEKRKKSIWWYSHEQYEAHEFLKEWKERTNIFYKKNSAWTLKWYGGKTIELYYYDGLVEAYTIGMSSSSEVSLEQFVTYAEEFEITEDHLRMIGESRF